MVFTGYASDSEMDDDDSDDDVNDDSHNNKNNDENVNGSEEELGVAAASKLKRHKLDVSVKSSREHEHRKRHEALRLGLKNISKVIISRRYEFEAGDYGLQARRARAIESYLHLVVWNGRKKIQASEMAAEAQQFASAWGGRMIRKWARAWIDLQELPQSSRGCHAKVFSLLEDPLICAELRSWLCTNKWAMNPAKLAQHTQEKIITPEVKKYLQNAVNNEMPQGLIRYIDTVLFPRLQVKVVQSISLRTAQRWLHKEAQANDGQKKEWVWDGEYKMRKKGVGRGLHRSDIICSTVGWLEDAGQELEYGKNYDGYWTGELFVKQLQEKIIPAFEAKHNPNEYQALIMVDNSQGHSAYAQDALLTCRMNMNPGGKQGMLRDTWFYDHNGHRVIQKMIDENGIPKGMKQKYLRDHCDYTFNGLKANMHPALGSVSLLTIRKWEHRMHRWMDAYRSGLGAKEAQFQVRAFSSRKYKSHRRVSDNVAQSFDT
ncbi:hypothetical protein GGU11DRAFT_819115 [Lentinula aff. detonsa]|nr:hypothetical protein GGU11DRAFT_819115 [Lentinula aff. detonsa]